MNASRKPVSKRLSARLRRTSAGVLALGVSLLVALPLAGSPAAALAASAPAPAAAADDGKLRVLLFYKEQFHASQAQARVAVKELVQSVGTEYGETVEIQETDQASAFTTENLATVDTLVFAQTGGVLFNDAQRAALETYIRDGGGYLGMHYAGWSVGQSEHDVNPFYARLVGAVSEGHPEGPAVRQGRVVVKDAASPLTRDLPLSFQRSDEWYDWVVNPAPNVRTLLEADESSYVTDMTGGRQGTSHPITWCQTIDAGRSWYTGMGHEGTAYSEPVMRTQIRNGLAYTAGLMEADCSPPVKSDAGAWSGVTPWPLMPINMALTSDGKVQSFGSVGGWGTDTTPYDWTGNSSITQGGQMEVDVWDPSEERTLANLRDGILANTTYTDLFCSMQVQNPHNHSTMTVGGDDGLGGNAPNDAAIGVTSYTTNNGLQNEAPMNFPRWYPTGSTMPDGSIVVQGGSLRGGPGGPGVLTPEIYTPDEGSGWKTLDGATSALAYGDGGNGNGPDENRWWYPRAFVAPGSGNLFNVSGTQMFELDPDANGGTGAVTSRGTLPTAIANQGALGNPVGATSTATMYRPGKILQVGGGWWGNGGGPDGANAGLTIDITGGTANPVVAATQPMKYKRHWATSTILPDGDVLVTGGGRENNGRAGYVTNAEIWNPDSGAWTEVAVPYEHGRLYHSAALLLPDGRIMMGGGGAPGPWNYTDVEYYSPSYLFDGNEPAVRPVITSAPKKIGYDGDFSVAATGTIERVTLVRNGSVTHGFNNDQNFQDLEFTQTGGTLSITSPQDGTYAPPGAYMLFAFDENGTPSVAKILDIDPEVPMDSRTPQVVDQFEYPRLPTDWRGGNPTPVIDVAVGNGRMTPWTVEGAVQLVRGTVAGMGGMGLQGYHLGLGGSGNIERVLKGLDPGREYRISLRYARDGRSAAGLGDASTALSVGDLTTTLTRTAAQSSQNAFGKYVGTFTAAGRQQALRLTGSGNGGGMMIDDLVVVGADPGASDIPVRYEFEEGTGTTAANTGQSGAVGDAVLTGTTGWSPNGVLGGALNLPGGANTNAVDLPDNLLQNATDFTTSFWVRPDTKGNWINLFHIGDGLGDAGSFFQIQMQTQDRQGGSGLAATFKKKGSNVQERIYATPTRDVTANQWSHVAFTRTGSTGTLYLDGEQIATRNNLTLTMTDVGPTANNWLGRNGYPDPAFDGLMDDVRVYTSALTTADIAAMYDEGSALRTTTTVSVAPVSPSAFGEPLTVSATIAGETDAPAQGTAQLWVDGASVGSAVEVVDEAVTFPALTLTPGAHEIEVRFVAADGFRDSTATVTHTVERPPPGEGVPIRYSFDEGTGTTAANSGTDPSIGAATLEGSTSWIPGRFNSGINLPGGASGTNNQVRLPDNIDAGMDEEFSISVWARPDALPNWVPLVQIGSSTDTFFLLQSSTQVAGASGFAATFKAPGNAAQERLTLGAGNDLPLNAWTHVVFTMSGSTGRLYFDGELVGTRNDFTLGIADVGVGGNTTANFLGGTSWPDPRFDGLVDEFQMYGYELSADQIGELFEGPPVNATPVGVADSYSTDEDEVLTVAAPGVLANDTDADSDALTATGVTQPGNGSVTVATNGSFDYTPDAGFSGTDTFTYRASDATASSAATTVTITVNASGGPDNTAPVGVADAYSTDEGEVLTVAAPGVLANDTDVDSDALTATSATQPANGTVALAAGGGFTYTPRSGFSGTDTFTYKADDGTLASTATTVTITVNDAEQPEPVNTAPVAVPDAYSTVEGSPLPIAAPGVLANDTDSDGDALTAMRLSQPLNGTVTLAADGSFVYLPEAGFSGKDGFTYRAGGGTASSAPATVTITVKPAGNPPQEPGQPAVTAIAGAAAPITYGGSGSVSVTVTPVTATGTVEIRQGGTVLASGPVSAGRATLVLAARALMPGTQDLTLGYVGDANHKATSASVQMVVEKVQPTMKVNAPSKVEVGTSAKVRVRLWASDGVPVTGTVSARLTGGKTLTGTVKGGRVVFKLPRSTRPGKLKVTVRYLGSGLAEEASGKVVVKIRR